MLNLKKWNSQQISMLNNNNPFQGYIFCKIFPLPRGEIWLLGEKTKDEEMGEK